MPDANQPFNPYKLFIGSFIPNALLRFTGLSSTAKLVWARLAQYAGENGVAFPKITSLAEEIGLSESQAQRLLNELEKKDFIRRIKPTGPQRLQHLPDSYVFLFHQCFASHLCVSGPSVDAISGPRKVATSGPRVDTASNIRESVLRESDRRRSIKAGEPSPPAAFKRPSSADQPTLTPPTLTPDPCQQSELLMDVPSAPIVSSTRPPYLPRQLPLEHPVCQVLTRFADCWAAMSHCTLDVAIARAIKEIRSRLQTAPLPDLLQLIDLWFHPGLSWVTAAERGSLHTFIQPRAISELKGLQAGLSTLKLTQRTTIANGHLQPLLHEGWQTIPSGDTTL